MRMAEFMVEDNRRIAMDPECVMIEYDEDGVVWLSDLVNQRYQLDMTYRQAVSEVNDARNWDPDCVPMDGIPTVLQSDADGDKPR